MMCTRVTGWSVMQKPSITASVDPHIALVVVRRRT